MFELSQGELTKTRQGYVFVYVQIVFNQLRRYALLDDPPPNSEIKGFRKYTQDFELRAERLETRIVAAITTSLFLEAYIFDYCARKKSASFAKEYLDKMEPRAKWIITTQLLCSPGILAESSIAERMKGLFRLRNQLVHHKTKENESFYSTPDFPTEFDPQHCIQLITDTMKELYSLDSTEEFAMFVVRHIGSWFRYCQKDGDFYPILWDA